MILLSSIEQDAGFGWATLLGVAGFAMWSGWWLRGLVAQFFTARAVRLALQRRVPNPSEMERACTPKDSAWTEAARDRDRVRLEDSGARARIDFELSCDEEPVTPLLGKRARGGRP